MVVIDPNVQNVGLIGASGEGKSYTFENILYPRLNKSILLIDPKNQYAQLKKAEWDQYTISGENPITQYDKIMKGIRFNFIKTKKHFQIRWIVMDPQEGDFNRIVGPFADLGNVSIILEEAHMFKRSILKPFKELELTMRLRTGKHNKNSNVIWISQLVDVPKPVYANTQVLFLFKHWDNVIETLENNRTIPEGLTFKKQIGKKPDGSPVYNYHIISR